MEYRVVLAVVLSVVVMVGYYTLFPPSPPPENNAPTTLVPAEIRGLEQPNARNERRLSSSSLSTAEKKTAATGRTIVIETPLYRADFNTLGAVLTSFVLKNYRRHKPQTSWQRFFSFLPDFMATHYPETNGPVQLVENNVRTQRFFEVGFPDDLVLDQQIRHMPFTPNVENLQIAQTNSAQDGRNNPLRFSARSTDGIEITKIFHFNPDTYVLDYELEVRLSKGKNPRTVRIVSSFGDGPGNVTEYTGGFGRHAGPIWLEDGELNSEDVEDISERLLVRNPSWVGIADSYFLSVAESKTPINHAFYLSHPVNTDIGRDATYGFEFPQTVLSTQRPLRMQARVYLGPKHPDDMKVFDSTLEESEDLTLQVLAGPMLNMMRWLHSYTGNYGWAIVILTMLVRVVLFPLTYKGMVAMKRMQTLQPKFKALREKHSKDKTKMNKALMDLYKRNKVNPLGGCLPVLAQIPIFFALYSALLGAIELRHAPFLWWLTDLSVKDPLFILPVLMGASMFAQQLLMPSTLDPMQRRVMLLMPVMFLVFTFNFPSGLVLYWFVSNMLSIVQQLIINRIKIAETT